MRIRSLWAGIFALMAGGCWGHVFPVQTEFPSAADGRHAQVFVDANGTFYPSGWDVFMKPQRPWKEDSLLNEATDQPQFRNNILADEDRQLGELAVLVSTKRRVFIFVHGYNNTVKETGDPYDRIENLISPGPDDAIIRFNWDGLTGVGIGGGKIWFNATGNSQLVGMRGLRRILDRISGRDIYIVSHSRGASVVLSALSDPPFDPRFLAKTLSVATRWPGGDPGLFSPKPLTENGNRIRVLMLAPAVDRIDFCNANETSGCVQARHVTTQLCSIRYTVNAKDPVLRKFAGLQGNFNPTRLGQDAATGDYLKTHGASYLMQTVLDPEKYHRFSVYLSKDPVVGLLQQMLRDKQCHRRRESES